MGEGALVCYWVLMFVNLLTNDFPLSLSHHHHHLDLVPHKIVSSVFFVVLCIVSITFQAINHHQYFSSVVIP